MTAAALPTIAMTAAKVVLPSLIQGALTGAAAYSDINAGRIAQQTAELNARNAELRANQIALQGRQQSIEIRRQLDRDLASQSAAFAARGVLTGEGSAAAAADESRTAASDDIETVRFNTTTKTQTEAINASQMRLEGSAQRAAGKARGYQRIGGFIANQAVSLLD